MTARSSPLRPVEARTALKPSRSRQNGDGVAKIFVIVDDEDGLHFDCDFSSDTKVEVAVKR